MLKKIGLSLLVTPLVIIVLFVSLFLIIPLVNNVNLSKFEKQFSKHQLPPETTIVEKESILGKLNGNGNGLDFLAAILVDSSLSVDELTSYYTKETFKNAKRSGEYPVITEVLPVTGAAVDSVHLEHGSLTFDALKDIADYSGYYFIILYDGGYGASFDLRGH